MTDELSGQGSHTDGINEALAVSADAGAGIATVLLHEGAGAIPVWDSLRPRLRKLCRTVAYDRRGFGASPRDASFGPRHFDQAVDDLAALLGEHAQGPAHLVGHSDGATIALLTASRHPGIVRSVTAIAGHVCADPETLAGLRALGAPTEWGERTTAFYRRIHGEDWADVVSSWLTMWTSEQGLAGWDMRAELSRIGAPVLVVHDRGDELSPAWHADAVRDLVVDARLSWYSTGTHRPHLAERDRFVGELADFWA